jgi:hypothetical protein
MSEGGAGIDHTRKGEDGRGARIYGASVEKDGQRVVVHFAPLSTVAVTIRESGGQRFPFLFGKREIIRQISATVEVIETATGDSGNRP